MLYFFTPNGGSEFVLPLITSEMGSLQLSSELIVPIAEEWGSIFPTRVGAAPARQP